MKTTHLLFPALAAIVAGCVTAPAASADPVGCWYFERDAAADSLNLPWGIRLAEDALDAPAHPDARVARTLRANGETDFPFGFWAPLEGDSIMIGHAVGGGLVLRLARGDSSMGGIVRPVGDVVAPGAPPRVDRRVRLILAQCPATTG